MKFLIPSIVLLILSGLGIFFIFKINNSTETAITITTPTLTPTSIPTQIPTITITPVATATATITPTATPSTKTKTKITPTSIPTKIPTITVIPTPTIISSILNFKNTNDSFSVNYSSNRKLYQDTESSGNRYTFYSPTGNFAVHVAKSGTWSWTNPDRNFNSDLVVSGQNTYHYDISTQTIVDLQSSTKNYTIQCVHNGKEALKTECEEFINSFQLL
ncbi:MAG: hypothetical protein PHD49_04685 [Candidatus Shapirobacteria bacterium]|nr:hypothetical protein [Candidatus Shapirobacteria bacterium]MDD4383408.1 hypothetical protein [Candidatus Shapirobacteria bacterium]